MTWPIPDSRWLDALKLPGRTFAGLFLFSLLTSLADRFSLIDLANFGLLARPIMLVSTLLFASLSFATLAGIGYDAFSERRKLTQLSVRLKIRREEKERGRAHHEANVLKRLDYLSAYEVEYLADCLRKNEQSFLTYVYSPPVANLQAKGMVLTPGGPHHQDHYPFYIVDFVWDALLKRKEEFIAKDDERKRREDAERAKALSRRPY